MRSPLIVVPCLLLALSACARKTEKQAAAPANPAAEAKQASGLVVFPPNSAKLKELKVEPVKMAEVPTDEVISPGQVELNPNRVSRVVLPLAGRVESVLVKLGDAVTRDQPLLTLESPDAGTAQSAYLQSEAQLTQARAAQVKAQSDYDRASDLYNHNAIARKEVLSAENALVQAKAGVQQAQAVREQAISHLTILGLKPGDFGQKITVRAPQSGKVLEMIVAPGEYRNDTTTPVITVADLSTVWVSADVPESYIRFVQVGERVDVALAAYPGEDFRARVARIADTVDPQTRTVKVRAEMENPSGRLRPDMFGTFKHTEATHVVPVVPVSAVVQGDGRSVVYVEVSPGRFQQTEVKVAKRVGDVIPVLSGVKQGERVVVDGVMLLKSM